MINYLNKYYTSIRKSQESFFIEKRDYIECHICPRYCQIKQNTLGFCEIWGNNNSYPIQLKYFPVSVQERNKICRVNIHSYPSDKNVWVVGFEGCNLKCQHCINYKYSYQINFSNSKYIDEKSLINTYIKSGCDYFMFSITEQSVFAPKLINVFRQLKKSGAKIIMATNAFISKNTLEILTEWVDLFKIDLKGFSEESYYKMTQHKNVFKCVLETIDYIMQKGNLIELTYCLIPEVNDQIVLINNLKEWSFSLPYQIPFTFTKYIPASFLSEETTLSTKSKTVYNVIMEKSNFSNIYWGEI